MKISRLTTVDLGHFTGRKLNIHILWPLVSVTCCYSSCPVKLTQDSSSRWQFYRRLVLSRSAAASSPSAAGWRQTPDRLYVILICLLGQKLWAGARTTKTKLRPECHHDSPESHCSDCLYLNISVFWSVLCSVVFLSHCSSPVASTLRFTPDWLLHRCQTFLKSKSFLFLSDSFLPQRK